MFLLIASCPQLSSLTSGVISLMTDGTKTIAHYACAEGYYLDGLAYTACSDDGTWNDSIPVCSMYMYNCITFLLYKKYNGFM